LKNNPLTGLLNRLQFYVLKMNKILKNRWLARIRLMVFVVAGIVLISGCKTERTAIKTPIKEEGAGYLFLKLKENELRFTDLSARFSADYKNANQESHLSGQIRIRKDSLIWLSLSAMGIEGMRILITQDSVRFINRMDKTYFKGDWTDLNRFLQTNIDYDVLQSFLIGHDISFYEEGKFKASIDRGNYKLTATARQKLRKYFRNSDDATKVFIQNIWLDPTTFKIIRADVKEVSKQHIKLDATYHSFEEIGEQLFPREMVYQISAENKIHVDVSFSRINIEKTLKFPFTIPSSYTRFRL
jgi:outer membrane lipoprotein-sorting protein